MSPVTELDRVVTRKGNTARTHTQIILQCKFIGLSLHAVTFLLMPQWHL